MGKISISAEHLQDLMDTLGGGKSSYDGGLNEQGDNEMGGDYDGTATSPYPSGTSGNLSQANAYPTGAQTLGQPIYPWLQRYEGNRTAPMSNEENQGLNAYGNFMNNGMGLGGSQNYMNDVLGGKYLDVANNPYFKQIKDSGQGLKDYQDNQATRRIASSMAAGGNALSGANAAAQGDYMNNSNNQFDQMMGNLYANQYARERGYQQDIPGMQNNMARTEQSGLQGYMQAGALPRQLQQNENDAQYGDWLHQIGQLQDQNRYSDQLATQTLRYGYPGSHSPAYGQSGAEQTAGLLASLFGKDKNGDSTLSSLLKALGLGPKDKATPTPGKGGSSPGGAPAHNPDGSVKKNAQGQPVDENGQPISNGMTGDTDENGNPIMTDSSGSFTEDQFGERTYGQTDDNGNWVPDDNSQSYNSDWSIPNESDAPWLGDGSGNSGGDTGGYFGDGSEGY